MRLINTETLAMENFVTPPPYAILSHTWGLEETSYQDFKNPFRRAQQSGFHKIQRASEQARVDGLGYVWVDTCCIDKTSSAELTEAINSMFNWYQSAAICYAYLPDVPKDGDDIRAANSKFSNSRWFTRGWTLQELIAPSIMVFYGAGWAELGYRESLATQIEQITRIDQDVLLGTTSLKQVSVAKRMSWAFNRQTTRDEDMAYCLLGLFDINIPMLYGEGGLKAFTRLQEEIFKETGDESLFAWTASAESLRTAPYRGLFASSPAEFQHSANLIPFQDLAVDRPPMGITSRGVPITNIIRIQENADAAIKMVRVGLRCRLPNDHINLVAIDLECKGGDQFFRCRPSMLFTINSQGGFYNEENNPPTVYVTKSAHESILSPIPNLERQNALYFHHLPSRVQLRGLVLDSNNNRNNSTYPLDMRRLHDDRVICLRTLVGGKIGIKMTCPWSTGCILLVVWAAPSSLHTYQYWVQALVVPSGVRPDSVLLGQIRKPPNAVTPQQRYQHVLGLDGPHALVFKGKHGKVQGFDMFSISIYYQNEASMEEEIKATVVNYRP